MLSIIAVNYNKANLLHDFFGSITNNGFEDYELIFVDDCSSDDSVRIAREYPCKLIKNEENLGPAASRNAAARIAQGDVLVFCDSDITIDPGGLQRISERFGKNHVQALFGKLDFPPLRNTLVGNYWLCEEREVCHYGGVETGFVNCWSSTLGAVSKELFFRIGGFNESYKGADIEDHELAIGILKHTKVFYDEQLTFHHYYPGSRIVIWKVFHRSLLFALSTRVISSYDTKTWVSAHRKAGFLLSALLTLAVVQVPVAYGLGSTFAGYSWFLPGFLVILKLWHHRYFFKFSMKEHGILFNIYCFFMLNITAVAAMAGVVAGRAFRILTPSHDPE